MKIAAGNDPVRLGQDKRIVGRRIGLDFQRPPGHAQEIDTGADDLGLAADAIGILHARVAL